MRHSQVRCKRTWVATAVALGLICCLERLNHAQESPAVIIHPPIGIPAPGPATDQPYVPQPILPGGIVVQLYPANSAFLKSDRIKELKLQYPMNLLAELDCNMMKSESLCILFLCSFANSAAAQTTTSSTSVPSNNIPIANGTVIPLWEKRGSWL